MTRTIEMPNPAKLYKSLFVRCYSVCGERKISKKVKKKSEIIERGHRLIMNSAT